MQPWPTAYTFWHRIGQPTVRLLVTRAGARPATADESALSPGEVVIVPDASVLRVRAGEGVVEIMELQPAGKRRMPAAEFLRGRRPHAGDRLGFEAS
jgi:methionyl-tRNA formyltransferase